MAPIAGQSHDLVLNGEGYMLVTGTKSGVTYKRKAAGPANIGMTGTDASNFEALNGPVGQPVNASRRAIWSKWSGLGQGMVAGADGWQKAQTAGKVNDLVSLRPVQDGGALALVPQGVTAQVDASTLSANNVFSVSVGGFTVVSFDTKIYRSLGPGVNNSGFTLLATAAANITGMCTWNGQVLVTEGTTLKTLNLTTGVLTAFTPVQACTQSIAYQGVLVVQSGTQLVFLVAGAWVGGPILENAITSFEELNGSLYIGTHTALYRLDGALQPKSPATAPNTLDYWNYKISVVWRAAYNLAAYWTENNFSGMTAWKGYLWFFANNKLYRAAPVQGRDTMQPEAQPVQGLSLGLRVCGNLLVVVTRVVSGGACTTWANDGNYGLELGLGWFKIATGGQWFHPFPNAGYNQGMVNVASIPGANSNFTRYLFDPGTPVGWKTDNYSVARTAVTGKVTLPLVTPEDLADLAGATNGKLLSINLKRVGIEWSVIDGGAYWPTLPLDGPTLAAWVMGIEISQDFGFSWTTLVDPAGGPKVSFLWFYGNRFELPFLNNFLPSMLYPAAPANGLGGVFGPVPDMGWLIRVSWGGTVAPLLRRVWLDYDVAELQQSTGQSWEFTVQLTDPLIGLDSAVDASNAPNKISLLYSLLKNGTSVNFQDLDGVTYRVKITGLELERTGQGAMPNLSPGYQAKIKIEEMWAGN